MKRRTRLRIKIWLILAVFIISSTVLWVSCKSQEEIPITIEIAEVKAEAPETKQYILAIPLSEELQEQLYEASKEFGVDYYIMVALIEKETKFCNVTGDGGRSYGYCQIQPRWWSGIMADIGAKDLLIPKDNFRTGCAIMAQLTARYKSVEGALVAYNQGHYRGYSTKYSREIIANAGNYRK